jgi:uncharacterized protein (DUF488 family)
MPSLYTIGHSTRSLEEFISLLKTYHITILVDVRTVPKSRHVPWFNENELQTVLGEEDITYIHMAELGGLRHPHKDSINQGWRNESFRGFADYMQTPEFYEGLKVLNRFLETGGVVAIMCAEAVPWRCHRSLIADAEIIQGVSVFHIMSETIANPHNLTPFAVVDRTTKPIKIYYLKD